MNIRKTINYGSMYVALNRLMVEGITADGVVLRD